jgi:hypothetical protein
LVALDVHDRSSSRPHFLKSTDLVAGFHDVERVVDNGD